MDNHKAALWCWAQSTDLSHPHNLLHIDRHYDTLSSQLDEWIKHLPELTGSIDDYLNAKYQCSGISCGVLRWDNYLSIYLEKFGNQLIDLLLATHEEGDKPKHDNITKIMPWDMPYKTEYWMENHSSKWIINIDLDYFFTNEDDKFIQIFSDEYIENVFKFIHRLNMNDKVHAITLCLTPDDYTPGWNTAETMATKALSVMGKHFKLP